MLVCLLDTYKKTAYTISVHRLWRCEWLNYLLLRQIRNGGGKIKHLVAFSKEIAMVYTAYAK